MSEPSANDELTRLLEALCNGALGERDAERLDAMLEADPAARRRYLAWMTTEAELFALHAQPAETPSVERPAAGATTTNRERESPPAWRMALAIAASLLAVAVASSWLTRRAVLSSLGVEAVAAAPDRRGEARLAQPDRVADAADEKIDQVARVTGTRNCRWRDDAEVGYGADLVAGQRLDLLAGLAEVTFATGAKVVLEGPASLELDEEGHATLVEGQLCAAVPSGADSFYVRTRRIGVSAAEQHGVEAQFGLSADGRGGGEVHALRGPLMACLLDQRGAQLRTVELRDSEAARLMPAATTLARFHADGDQFDSSGDHPA